MSRQKNTKSESFLQGFNSIFFKLQILTFVFISWFRAGICQQVVDPNFKFIIPSPAFESGKGPVVMIDTLHNNQDVHKGNYQPLFDLLVQDGYVVNFLRKGLTKEALGKGSILIIINPLEERNLDHWNLPVYPVFAKNEIETVYTWVIEGGSLLLAIDHMPFPEASKDLAKKFGIKFNNGFAIDTITWDPLIFSRSKNTLRNHAITNGKSEIEKIDSVESFWGQAFQIDSLKVTSILTLGDNAITYEPDTAWRFSKNTPIRPVKNWSQGAAGAFGNGRVVILGECGMLTAQLTGRNYIKTGMNSPGAAQNAQFILNALHWLSKE